MADPIKDVKATEHEHTSPDGIEPPKWTILKWTCPHCGRHNTNTTEGHGHCICGNPSNVKK